jgi:hypothetical protein
MKTDDIAASAPNSIAVVMQLQQLPHSLRCRHTQAFKAADTERQLQPHAKEVRHFARRRGVSVCLQAHGIPGSEYQPGLETQMPAPIIPGRASL